MRLGSDQFSIEARLGPSSIDASGKDWTGVALDLYVGERRIVEGSATDYAFMVSQLLEKFVRNDLRHAAPLAIVEASDLLSKLSGLRTTSADYPGPTGDIGEGQSIFATEYGLSEICYYGWAEYLILVVRSGPEEVLIWETVDRTSNGVERIDSEVFLATLVEASRWLAFQVGLLPPATE